MNCRRILIVASGSRLWKRPVGLPVTSDREVVSRRTFTMVDSPTPAVFKLSSRDLEMRNRKSDLYVKLFFVRWPGHRITDDLDEFMKMECRPYLSKRGLMAWAKKIREKGELKRALEMFEWLERNDMSFSPSEHAIFLELICKIKGVEAAQAYFKKIDPNFNRMDPHAKNWPAYQKLVHLCFQRDPPEEFEFHPVKRKWVRRHYIPKLTRMVWVTDGEATKLFGL